MRTMTFEAPGPMERVASPQEALAHADELFHLARYLTRNRSDAEDLVQETFSRALQALHRLQPGSNVRAWLFRILRNTFLSGQRHGARGPVAEPEAGDELTDVTASDAWLRGDAELERLRHLVGEEIEAALAALSPDARTLILLDIQGLTESELAEVVGCPIGTVKSRLSRARAALRVKLADYGPEGRS